MRARGGGVITAAAFGGIPIGAIVGGVLVESTGLTNAILVGTAAYFAASMSPVVGYRLWREIDDTTPKQQQPWIGHVLAGLRVSLHYTDGEWSLSARHRGRRIASQPVEPKVAVDALARLENEPVHAAVSEVLTHDRSLAEAQVHKARQRIAGYGQYAADGGVSYPYPPVDPR